MDYNTHHPPTLNYKAFLLDGSSNVSAKTSRAEQFAYTPLC